MRYVFGITGASGAPYAVTALDALARGGCQIMLVVSELGSRVLERETGLSVSDLAARVHAQSHASRKGACLETFAIDDMFSPIASGSFETDGMIIMPCTMGTVAGIAAGTSDNLLRRAADVTLKEGRRLVVVPREMPFSIIHLRNLLSLAEAGARIVPASPYFYDGPAGIEDIRRQVAGRALAMLGVETDLVKPWGVNETYEE